MDVRPGTSYRMTAALGLRAVRDGTMSYTHFSERRKMQKHPQLAIRPC